ncbi:nuclease-related domain-containing protein [Streptomyces sp. NPDC097619]|uniref:nuclease-related domain-containing protein n=1 Tax=Streptomyces sp. NPDC097619 TaxID=3157228 RepID=UPI00331BF589
MRGPRVVPARAHGLDRLYVTGADGTCLAWYDRTAGRVSLIAERDRDAVLTALRPYLTRPWTLGPPPAPGPAELLRLALPPDEDLAPNRPGEPLLGAFEYGGQGARTRLRARPLLLAQQRFGAELDTLEAAGWRVLHAVPLPGAACIDHLLIGPGGVLAVRTAPARRRRAAVGELLLTLGQGAGRPDPRRIRAAALRASRALATAVTPVLAVIDATRLTVAPTLRDVRVLSEGASVALAAEPATLKQAELDALYATARDRRTWSRC